MLLAWAIEKGGTTDPDAIEKALPSIDGKSWLTERIKLTDGNTLARSNSTFSRARTAVGRALQVIASAAGIVKGLNERGVTIVLVEKNARMPLKLADYGYVLDNGRIRMAGDGATLRAEESIVHAYLGGAQ